MKIKTITIPANTASYSLGLTETEKAGAKFVSITSAAVTIKGTHASYGSFTGTGTFSYQSFYVENIGNGTSSSSVNLSSTISGLKVTSNINISSNTYSLSYTNFSNPSSVVVPARTITIYYFG